MNDLKIYKEFVNDQLNDFYDDFNDSKKRIKLFTTFSSISLSYEKSDIKIASPKKRFQSKVKLMNKKNDKGIF